MANENLGPAEKILETVLKYSDHAYHGRPGIVIPDPTSTIGGTWLPVTHVVENGDKVVYELRKVGKKTTKVKLGKLKDDGRVKDVNRVIGRYQPAGLFEDVAVWLYRQVVEVWKLDNEFAAKWASHEFMQAQERRDLKVIMAAFLLVQSRKGDPVIDAGQVAFYDEDYRDVGEAMLLLGGKDLVDGKSFNPRLLLRVHDVLMLPGVAAINRELGFGQSARNAFLGRWDKAVEKWLRFREENSRLLEGLVKAGFRRSVIKLVQRVRYKPTSARFFEVLRWKQIQAADGRRSIAIGQAVAAAESWEGFTEQEICEAIIRSKPSFKRLVGQLPKGQGLTRAIVAAAIEVGAMSDKELIIATPTLEDLGLLVVPEIRERWERATKGAEDTRAANIATRVRSRATQEKLQEAADNAVKSAVAEVIRGLRIYVIVDISGSMSASIDQAKTYIAKFLQAFPLEQLHVSVFNTSAREVVIKHATAAGVENAFRGISAGGGTLHSAGVRVLQKHKPKDDEDALFIFVGDEEEYSTFEQAVRDSGVNPVAFGLLKVRECVSSAVRDTAAKLGIPCFMIEDKTFSDVYAIPRVLRALISATPVGKARGSSEWFARVSLVDTILSTKLLAKPTWAA